MIFKDAQHIYSFSNETDPSNMLEHLCENLDLHKPQSMLMVLQYLQAAKLIRSVDRNFARYIYQAFLDQQNTSTHTTLDGIVLLVVALLSKHIGNGHVCLNIDICTSKLERLLSSRDIRLEENSPLSFSMISSLIDKIHQKMHSLSASFITEQLLASNIACEYKPEQTQNSPLIIKQGRCYLERLHNYETIIVKSIKSRLITLPEFEHKDSAGCVVLSQALHILFRDEDPNRERKSLSQKLACALAARSRFSVITGGPGTGKTTTVVKLLAALQSVNASADNKQNQGKSNKLRIGLAAPTGKAAARLTESISASVQKLPLDELPGHVDVSDIPTKVSTIDVLLGRGYNTRKFTFNQNNPLPLDLLVVDEASMVDVDLMAALMNALEHQTRIILLGDKDQLASVDAGAVLGDLAKSAGDARYSNDTIEWLCAISNEPIAHLSHLSQQTQGAQGSKVSNTQRLQQNISQLDVSFRFDAQSGIKLLSDEVNNGNASSSIFDDFQHSKLNDSIWLKDGLDVHFSKDAEPIHSEALTKHFMTGSSSLFNKAANSAGLNDIKTPAQGYRHYMQVLKQQALSDTENSALNNEHASRVLEAFDNFRVLCAIRSGPWGVDSLNHTIERELLSMFKGQRLHDWYEGRPVLVTKNDYNLGLMNGDIGITFKFVQQGSNNKTLYKVAFKSNDSERHVRWFSINRLQNIQTAFAMTVHKSQGSEFAHACLVLPQVMNPILTRELVYTAITRAKSWFSLVTPNPDILAESVMQKVSRDSGLLVDFD